MSRIRKLLPTFIDLPGMGYAIADQLQSRGCSILGTCSTNENLSLINHLKQGPGPRSDQDPKLYASNQTQVHGVVADILSPTCAVDIADALETHYGGRVDILVLNAAITGSVRIGDSSSHEKASEIQPYLLGNIQTSVLIVDELVRRHMFRANSRIVCISSIRSKQSTPMS
jgi:NAD(P)-dependent dehydrogenase (short-subunit alcohol dehydrogenase family)